MREKDVEEIYRKYLGKSSIRHFPRGNTIESEERDNSADTLDDPRDDRFIRSSRIASAGVRASELLAGICWRGETKNRISRTSSVARLSSNDGSSLNEI